MSGTREKGVNSTTCEYKYKKITVAHEKDWQVQDNKGPQVHAIYYQLKGTWPI